MKKIVLLSVFWIISSIIFAQSDSTKVARDITIEREYNPIIMDAQKVNQNLRITEPTFPKKEVVYSSFDSPLSIKSPSNRITQAPLNVEKRNNYKHGYAKLAIGVPLNWEVDFAYPLINTSNCKLDFSITHDGLWWNSKKEKTTTAKINQQYFDTQVDLNFEKQFSASTLYSNLSYRNRAFNYYGTTLASDTAIGSSVKDIAGFTSNSINKTYNRFNDVEFNIGYQSLPNTNFEYDVQLGYQLFNIPSQFSEHQIDVKTIFNIPIAKNFLSFKIGAENLFYTKSKTFTDSIGEVSSVIEFSPKFTIKRDAYHLHLGLKSFFAINRKQLVNVSPDVEIEYFINPKMVSFYVGAAGGYELNSLRALYQENWYLNLNHNSVDTYTPLDAYLGFKIKPISHLYIDAFARYKILFDQYFFVNQFHAKVSGSTITAHSNTFTTVYSRWQLLNVGLHLRYNYKDRFDIFLKGQYNGWFKMKETTQEYAWHRPICEVSVGGNVNITEDVRLSANYSFMAGRRITMLKPDRLRDIHDVNISASYSYNNWLTAYLKVDNLLGMIPALRYQKWYGYDVLGSVMAGVIFSF